MTPEENPDDQSQTDLAGQTGQTDQPAHIDEQDEPGQAEQHDEAREPNDQNNGQPDEPEPADQPDAQSTDLKPEDQLQAIIEMAKSGRLSPVDEDRAVQLLKQAVAGGPKALPSALDAMLTLPWSVGVKAVTEAWPETKPAGRTRLVAGLAKLDSDISRRIRLSLARGLHAQDAGSALKLILSVCEAMGGAQGGSSTKDRQIFANVMLGKARPWLMNIPMADMKPAEAHKLITPALESCSQSPIFTQIWVLRWICEADKFSTLPPEHVESVGKSINRWQPRWRKELRKIIPKLPEALEAVLVDGHSSGPAAPVRGAEAPSAPVAEGDVNQSGPADDDGGEGPASGEESQASEQGGPADRQPEQRQPQQRQAEHRQQPSSRAPDPRDRSSRDRPQAASGPFDLTRSLRDIEAYVVRLRSDLQQAQVVARRREPAPERSRGRMSQQAPASAEELDEMRRHNQQLEEQNQELRVRIEELTNDHEDRAATLEINDALEQFKTYLGLKLKEDYADYTAISREALNEVVRRHAHEILGRIFGVLRAEGVRFDRPD